MKGTFWSTNSSIRFLLLPRTAAVKSPTGRFRRNLHRIPAIQDPIFLQKTTYEPPIEKIMQKEESKTLKASEFSSSSTDVPPQPPEKPDPGDCCGNGCFPCVWDLYYEQFEAYTKNLEAYNDRIASKQK